MADMNNGAAATVPKDGSVTAGEDPQNETGNADTPDNGVNAVNAVEKPAPPEPGKCLGMQLDMCMKVVSSISLLIALGYLIASAVYFNFWLVKNKNNDCSKNTRYSRRAKNCHSDLRHLDNSTYHPASTYATIAMFFPQASAIIIYISLAIQIIIPGPDVILLAAHYRTSKLYVKIAGAVSAVSILMGIVHLIIMMLFLVELNAKKEEFKLQLPTLLTYENYTDHNLVSKIDTIVSETNAVVGCSWGFLLFYIGIIPILVRYNRYLVAMCAYFRE